LTFQVRVKVPDEQTGGTVPVWVYIVSNGLPKPQLSENGGHTGGGTCALELNDNIIGWLVRSKTGGTLSMILMGLGLGVGDNIWKTCELPWSS